MQSFEKLLVEAMKLAGAAELLGHPVEPGYAAYRALAENLYAAVAASSEGVFTEERLDDLAVRADQSCMSELFAA